MAPNCLSALSYHPSLSQYVLHPAVSVTLSTQSLLPSDDSQGPQAWCPRPFRTCILFTSPTTSCCLPFFSPCPSHTAGPKLCSHPSASFLTCSSCWAHLPPPPHQNSAQGPSLRNLCWQHLTPHSICSPLLSPDIKYTNSIITLIALMTSGYGYLTVQLPVWGSAEKWGLQSHLTSHMLMLPPISYGAWHKFLNPSVPHFPHLQSERVIMVPASQAVVRMKWANIWTGLGTECGAGPPLHQC